MNDKQAIQQLKQGNIHALSTLIETYQVKAIRTAYLITQDAALAEDVVQNTFVSIYRSIHTFDVERPFAPWFTRSVVNAAIKAMQAFDKQTSLDTPDDDDFTDSEPFTDVALQPDQLIETAETEMLIWQMLGQLSTNQRAVIVLRFYLDYSEAEISQHLSIPAGTVKSRLHNAKRQLYALLASHLEQGDL